ncbi:MAG: PAS domain S-box protein [Hydrogenophilales bacterium]|nr:PAS domain S-box protein [Hydrogenophilales bacterium]
MPEQTRAELHLREAELLRSHRLLDAIAAIQSLYIRDASPRELFNEVLDTFLRFTESRFGFVGEVLADEAGAPFLRAHALTNIAWNKDTRALYANHEKSALEFHNLKSLFGVTLATGEPVISNDPANDPRSGGLPHGHPPLNAYLGLPLYSGKVMVGMIGLADRAGGYDEALIAILDPLLRTCGQLIQAFRADRERRQAVEALRESEARLKATLDTVVDGIIAIDERGRIESFNPAAEKIFGYRRDEVLGRNVSMLMPEPDRARHDGYLAHYLGTGDARIIGIGREVVAQRKDGSLFPADLAIAEMNLGGRRYFNGIVRDITRRRHAETLLRETTALQSAILDSADYALISTDPEGLIRTFNRAAERMTGYAAAEMVGIATPGILHDADEIAARAKALSTDLGETVAPGFSVFVAKTLRSGGADENEWTYIRKDGTRFPVLLSVTAMRDETGKITGFLGVLQDISERNAARARLERLTSELRAIFDLSPDGFVAFTETGQLAYTNPAFLRMTGCQRDAEGTVGVRDFDARLQALCDPRHAYAPLDTLVDQASDTLHLIRPKPAILQRSVRDIRGEAGGFLGRVLYFRDITHETEVDRMKTEFLSTAAHELRTPMASIHGFTELLLKRDYDDATRRDLLQTIYRQSSNLITMVNELLDLARIEARAGKDFHIQVQDILPIVDRVVREFMMPNDARKIELRLGSALPQVAVDAEKFGQALLNVISNAYKYSPDGGAIELATRTQTRDGGAEVGVVVHDHGIGMTPEQQARIFERFYRADASGAIPGTGLGMSLVKEIMDIHQGRVEIQSALGQVTEVGLWLPAAASAKRAGRAKKPQEKS